MDFQTLFESCTLCPRECHVDRFHGKTGYCGQSSNLFAARASLHMWEEPCISGEHGSGTVFFSGCPLGCIYCQNHNIAIGKTGKSISTKRLSAIFLELQEKGAHNINLVTPTHFIPQIVEALIQSKKDGLNLPIIYNTSSYEKSDTLRLLDGLIDIYLPDLKYVSSLLSKRYSNAPDYFSFAKDAIQEMYRQVGNPIFDASTGLMKRGMIVRHLILPNCLDDSKVVLKYLFDTYGNDIFISIMNQYTPVSYFENHPELNRTLSQEEYDSVVDYALELGIENGFIQEGETASESFIPPFDCEGI